jgi:stage V sporulation protein R
MKHIAGMEALAKEEGLDFFPVIFEHVDRDIMLEACSYGLPVRARHWSYGRSYQHQKIYGEMGLSKVYEIVFNNDPSYAFLMNTNPDVINIMVGAHVFGHVHFFKHNCMFKGSDRNMIHRAAERAARVDKYIEQLGLNKVEHLMDIGFSLDNHIDWHKGIFRKKYSGKRVITEVKKADEFEDLLNIGDTSRRSVKLKVVGDKLPPHPEKDLLWFLTNYAPLEAWERDILGIIREESFYFYPIIMTKIMNEGFASFWHAELMYKYSELGEEEYLNFAKTHSSVINPGNPFNINPYFVGFKVFTDIRERWDKLHEEGKSDINGIQKIIEVAAEEDDASFLRNYLTKELAIKLGLFNYGYRIKRDPEGKEEDLTEEHGIIELKDRELDKIIDNIIRPTINYGAPLITVEEVDGDALVMHHNDTFGPLDEKYTEKTMEFVYELWGGPIELKTYTHDGEDITYSFDESGFDIL